MAFRGDEPVSSTESARRFLAASTAWSRGDFAACLNALDNVANDTGAHARSEVILLRARTLLRLHQPRKVLVFLKPVLTAFSGVDSCHARMLYAAALARTGRTDQAISLLAEVASDSEAIGVDEVTRIEVTYYRAIAHWARREFEPAAKFALAVEHAGLDVLSVRGTHLLGFVAIGRERYSEALAIFERALRAYRVCRNHDGDLAAQVIFEIAVLQTQLRSKSVVGSHADQRSRQVAANLNAPRQSETKCGCAYADAWQFAHDGDAGSAFRKMREAERAAPNLPWRITAMAGRALVSAAFDERENSRDLLHEAADLAEQVPWHETVRGECLALLLLAEASATVSPPAAIGALSRYDAALRAQDPLQVNVPSDPRHVMLRTYVRGLVARTAGEPQLARALFEKAYLGFRAREYLWRAILALVELDATPSPASALERFHLDMATSLVREHFPRSFLARRIGPWANVYCDPIAVRLTPSQRQILRYALDGYGAKEIAAFSGRAIKTVGNQLSALHEAFGVKTTLQLVAECHRRGLGAPAWRGVTTDSLAMRAAGSRSD